MTRSYLWCLLQGLRFPFSLEKPNRNFDFPSAPQPQPQPQKKSGIQPAAAYKVTRTTQKEAVVHLKSPPPGYRDIVCRSRSSEFEPCIPARDKNKYLFVRRKPYYREADFKKPASRIHTTLYVVWDHQGVRTLLSSAQKKNLLDLTLFFFSPVRT